MWQGSELMMGLSYCLIAESGLEEMERMWFREKLFVPG
jgi:hypothetical protein